MLSGQGREGEVCKYGVWGEEEKSTEIYKPPSAGLWKPLTRIQLPPAARGLPWGDGCT